MSTLIMDNLSNCQVPMCHTNFLPEPPIIAPMMTLSDEALFNEALCARTHALRKERGWTAAQMATALAVPSDRYRKYEYRSPLPPYLMERFALIVGCDLEYLITGRASPKRKARETQGKKRA